MVLSDSFFPTGIYQMILVYIGKMMLWGYVPPPSFEITTILKMFTGVQLNYNAVSFCHTAK